MNQTRLTALWSLVTGKSEQGRLLQIGFANHGISATMIYQSPFLQTMAVIDTGQRRFDLARDAISTYVRKRQPEAIEWEEWRSCNANQIIQKT
jgi:hypothetical protein